ncbi:MAG: single-stranded-DNA-specific exonuclease RecJ [Verrucomicrobiia bacterium]
MQKSECRWILAPPQPERAARLAAALNVSPFLAQCLLNRGLTDPLHISRFLEPRLKQLSDPFLLPDMERAVDRLFLALERHESVVIFGDYDVDGVTSTALVTEVLTRLGWQVDCYLPHRLEEGYGLNEESVANCLGKHSCSLLLAVDCGSTAVGAIEWLRQRGVDTIVLDHHQVRSPAPQPAALVNPQVEPSSPYRVLCSVGLAFKLAHALVKRGRQVGLAPAAEFDLRPLLDLVALGTIADLVPLTGENRILVSAGLEFVNRRCRPGIAALAEVAGINRRIGVFEVGFLLGPRLNASGRLEHALQSLQLLLAKDSAEATALAVALDVQNRERQAIERKIASSVIGDLRTKFNPDRDLVIVEGHASWHLGVVGIVASRVLREFHRPTIILGADGAEWRGSGRSVEGFDLAAALRACSGLLIRHGGHAMAAGVSLPSENLDSLRQRLNGIARETLAAASLTPALRLDGEARLEELTVERVRELSRLEPVGQANPIVQLASRRLRHQRPPKRLGQELQHLKMWVTDGTATLPSLCWACPDMPVPEAPFDLAFVPQVNEFGGQTCVQLKVLDWKPSIESDSGHPEQGRAC